MNSLNMIDKIFLLVFFLSSLIGLFRGGVRETFSFLSWVAGLIVATIFAHPVASYLSHFSGFHSLLGSDVSGVSSDLNTTDAAIRGAGPVSVLALGISSLILFFGTVLIGGLIGRMANSAVEVGGISLFNRLFGGVFGVARAYLLGLLVVFALQLTPIIDKPEWTNSKIVQLYQPAVKKMGHLIQPGIDSLKNRITPALDNVGGDIQGELKNITMPSVNTNNDNNDSK